ncbi:NAD(P)-binding protein [Coniophora puteana RWD-64-598 SS2]|uniref:NAD(P)-binding protein n=1 Tax=Coniophora puteana (strain RWD-64-598) TaxID=741705 RepID=A0A5M3N6K7_CONPW|nr:NAD(P)-binding protein [Coniophora puteana RWD-64-598 SS2]EIW87063.1 NAD(P)-binding protein [Coniophora puteana RWD-64-598 SS2]
MPRKILVTGATGKQGSALVRALRPTSGDSQTSEDIPFQIIAITRDARSPGAQELEKEKHVRVVEGNLDSADSLRRIFEEAKEEGGIWGVFCVLAFPGLGASGESEEKQGKTAADIALEYGVSVYVYSSAERGGEANDRLQSGSGLAKVMIERHVKSLGEKGLPWTIMRPGFFLENYEGFIGSITVAVMKNGLKKDTSLAVITSEDIGKVAAGIFNNHEAFVHKELAVVGETATMPQQEEAYQRATGRSMPSIPNPLAKMLISVNKATKGLIDHMESVNDARVSGKHVEWESQLQLTRQANPDMQGVYEWALSQKASSPQPTKSGWNQVSLWKLITGKM